MSVRKPPLQNREQNRSPFADGVARWGQYTVGFLAALGAFVAGYFWVAERHPLIVAAAWIGGGTLFLSRRYGRFAPRLLGMTAAGAMLAGAYLMPDQRGVLLTAAAWTAGLTLFFA